MAENICAVEGEPKNESSPHIEEDYFELRHVVTNTSTMSATRSRVGTEDLEDYSQLQHEASTVSSQNNDGNIYSSVNRQNETAGKTQSVFFKINVGCIIFIIFTALSVLVVACLIYA